MKVTGVETCVLTVPTQKPIALEFAHHKLVIAQIATDEGITGLGYSLAFGGGGAEAIKVYLDTRLAPLVIGQDPLFVERLWERMFRGDRGIKRQGVAAYALSALESGCGTSPARRPAFLYISSGAPSPTGCRPTAAAAGRATASTTCWVRRSATPGSAAATTR